MRKSNLILDLGGTTEVKTPRLIGANNFSNINLNRSHMYLVLPDFPW